MNENITDNSYTSTQDNLKNKDANIKTRLKSYLTDLAAGIWKQMKSKDLINLQETMMIKIVSFLLQMQHVNK